MDNLSPDKRYCKIRKRKTRKCLNQIRYRCQQGGDINMENIKVTKKTTQHSTTVAPRNRPNILKANGSNITKARLTIQHGIFAKGVRSETISRPELSEEFRARMDENIYQIIDLANGQPKNTLNLVNNQKRNTGNIVCSSDMEIEVDLLNRSNKDVFRNAETVPLSVHKNVENTSNSYLSSLRKEISCTDNEARSSPLCITPPNKSIPTEKKSSNVAIGNIVLNTTSQDYDMDEKHYELYKEFNDMLPSYLNKYLPIENSEEIEDDLKSYLKDVYKDSCRRESEKNILGCISNRQKQSPDICKKPKSIMQKTMEESVLLNPIQYLKRVHHYQTVNDPTKQDISENISHNLDNSFECRKIRKLDDPGCSHYSNEVYACPESINEILQLSLSSDSSDELNYNSNTTIPVVATDESHEDNSLITIVDKSPEYTYYPRKIN